MPAEITAAGDFSDLCDTSRGARSDGVGEEEEEEEAGGVEEQGFGVDIGLAVVAPTESDGGVEDREL